MTIDRGGNELKVGDVVMVPTHDFLPGKGAFFTMTIGSIVEIEEKKFWYSFGKERGWHDVATIHTRYETVSVRCSRLVLLGA